MINEKINNFKYFNLLFKNNLEFILIYGSLKIIIITLVYYFLGGLEPQRGLFYFVDGSYYMDCNFFNPKYPLDNHNNDFRSSNTFYTFFVCINNITNIAQKKQLLLP